jgi:hypothetical protein
MANTNLKIQTLKKWSANNLSQLENGRIVIFGDVLITSLTCFLFSAVNIYIIVLIPLSPLIYLNIIKKYILFFIFYK